MFRKPKYTAHTNTDNSLVYLILSIILFGIVMIFNSTAVYAHDVFGGAYRFFFLQIVWVGMGLAGFFFFYRFDYHLITRLAMPVFLVSLTFLIVMAFIGILPCSLNVPFTPCVNGANRWFYFNPSPLPKLPFLGVLGFQPSELGKIALILLMAVVFSRVTNENKHDIRWFFLYMGICGGMAALVLMQPNMSTAMLFFGIGTIIYFVSGATLKPLLYAGPLMIILVTGLILLSPYRRERLTSFLSADISNVDEASYHVKQILIALGSGGFDGVGFGQSRQKFQYLPEVSADSIFAIIGEELGFVGTVFVIGLFGMLFYKGYNIADKSHDMLGKLLAVGVTSWVGFQFFINIAAMTHIIPLTGVPIPLISYGGSSTVFSLCALGILANVGKQIRS